MVTSSSRLVCMGVDTRGGFGGLSPPPPLPHQNFHTQYTLYNNHAFEMDIGNLIS